MYNLLYKAIASKLLTDVEHRAYADQIYLPHDNADSYKIVGAEKSEFVMEHKINTIPRYMLIDKSGKVVNANAPKPSSKSIGEMLNG